MARRTIKMFISTGLLLALIGVLAWQNEGLQAVDPVLAKESTVLKQNGMATFRDLNKNGSMDIYEDPAQKLENRVDDLLKQMTLEEKAGMMFINGARVNNDGSLGRQAPQPGQFAFGETADELMMGKKMNHFNLWAVPNIPALAVWYNAIQKYAEATRLGIPVTIASDPRHSFNESIFSVGAVSFSQWPEQLGLAAIGDTALTRKFADIVRQEYLAVGIREALHPVADLATEPRWPRIGGTFGEDANVAARMIRAYITGLQGPRLGPNSVAAMTKHFSGAGPQKEGLDAHFEFHKGQTYPGKKFRYHLIPFEAAFRAHTAAIMPYYGVPTDQGDENVGFSYNKSMITKLLRNWYHFDGVVCTDWGLITDTKMGDVVWPARAWGVEKLSPQERVKKIIDAGVDQFGGESVPEYVVQLVKEGKLPESRINASVRRLLRQKFTLGLFDNPFIDPAKSLQVVGNPEFKKAGEDAQRRAMTLLKNGLINHKKVLPLQQGAVKIYVQNISEKIASRYGRLVGRPEDADVAIIRLKTPWYAVETKNNFARSFHHGDLDFKGAQKDSILQLLNSVPTVVVINLDRPAVIPEINAKAKGLIAEYGASDAAVMDVVFGRYKPGGKLPFELPSSMEAVRAQKEDVPFDSKNPLYPFGFGMTY